MTSTRFLRTLAATAAVGVGLVGLSACGGEEFPDAPPVVETRYVGMGDSYTAVAGDGPYVNASCFRSEDGYVELLAEKLDLGAQYANVSCGGASSVDLRGQQSSTGNAPQLDALTDDTELVTIGIGLNDADSGNQGLGPALTLTCLPNSSGKQTQSCKDYLQYPDSIIDVAVKAMGKAVADNLADIKERAPGARIVFVGYPRTLSADDDCPSQLPIGHAAAERLRAGGAAVNEELKQVARSAGADYIDMYAASAGHEYCSDDPWVNGWKDVKGTALAFHPLKSYHVAVADELVALVGAL